jgi:hypothetical protein
MPLCHSRPTIDGDGFVPAALRMSDAAGISAATGRLHRHAARDLRDRTREKAHGSDVDSAAAAISLWVSNRPFGDGHHIGRTRFGIPLPSDDLSAACCGWADGWENSDGQDQVVCRCHPFDRDWFRSMGGLAHQCARFSLDRSGIQPFQLMVKAKGLPAEEVADYTFVIC